MTKRTKGFRKDGGIDRRFGRQPGNQKVERNAELIANHQTGISILDLCFKYHISASRVHEILAMYRAKNLDLKENRA